LPCQTPFTDQDTYWSVVPETAAVRETEPPGATVAEPGVKVTATEL
jgi:hypothetical protein